jgi:hypothetical protein
MSSGGHIVVGSLILATILSLDTATSRADPQASTASAPAVLHDLAGMPDLQALFDRESDKIRIVLLLSPT